MKDFRAERIKEWRESIAALPDEQFFEIMRIYLCGFSTPFNKQNLIEKLSAYLRNPENKKTIVSLLSEKEIQIIAAVRFVSGATAEKISVFFVQMNIWEIGEIVSNLEERLVLFRKESSGKTELCINPLLDDELEKIATRAVLLKEGNCVNPNRNSQFFLSSAFLASFVSFVDNHENLCKNDGSFKKKIAAEIDEIFPNFFHQVELTKKSFENLGILLCDSSGKYFIDRAKLSAFSRLSAISQKAFAIAASVSRLSRQTLRTKAEQLLKIAYSIPKGGFSKESLLRAFWLFDNEPLENKHGWRFSKIILQRENGAEKDSSFSDMRLIENAISLGFFRIRGTDEKGAEILEFSDSIFAENSENAKSLSVDAAFSVILFAPLPLERLCFLANFMEIRHFDTAPTFEITKESASRAFDLSISVQKIYETLCENCAHDLPQNLLAQLEDWHKSYGSVSLFSGIVLKTNENNAVFCENNPIFAQKIEQKLADGVFLLKTQDENEAREILEKAGINFVGKVRSSKKEREAAAFPEIYIEKPALSENSILPENAQIWSEEEKENHKNRLRQILQNMTLSEEEKECLLFRIERKIILSEKQLCAESVKFVRLEASGLDFSGKVHIIEQSVRDKIPIEMTFPFPPPNGKVVIGLPLSVEKRLKDVSVSIRVSGSYFIEKCSVNTASRVRQIYSSKF